VSLVSILQGRACLTTPSGFVNGIVAYGVSFIHVKLESWRILFMIEGGATVLIAIIAIIVLPDDIPSCKWFTAEEKDYRTYRIVEKQTNDPRLTQPSDVRALHEHGPGSQRDQLETGARCIVPLAASHA
jgi:hypothetical protein